MKKYQLMLAIAPLVFSTQAWAEDATSPADSSTASDTAKSVNQSKKAFTTGVARGRDMLNSAISASTLDGAEVQKMAPRSLAEILRNIPGVRAEAAGGEANATFTIRGLPSASSGAKFVQLQEDGLPVLEFGDITFFGTESFLRADLTLDQVQSIRGGSASTFSSNSPGGVINLISRTGDQEGGDVQVTAGLDYEEYRADFTYGARINDTLRFNIGGFYREGEGPRKIGYTGYRGGQVKLNVTKEFEGGYIRFYGKVLDDRSPLYSGYPVRVTGSDANPDYNSLPGFDIPKDTLLSRYITNNVSMDGNNNLVSHNVKEGQHSKVKSFGVETKFDVEDWTITDNFRYSDISGASITHLPVYLGPASAFAARFAGPGAILSYATGPNAGQVIADPSTLNGNGMLSLGFTRDNRLNSLDYVVNDLRASRVWEIGDGKLTTTAGFYKSHQEISVDNIWSTVFSDVRGDGNAALIDIATAGGFPVTQNGVFSYGVPLAGPNGAWHRRSDVGYSVNAPYASFNFSIGKLAIGGSLRYDFGKVEGNVFGGEIGGGRVGETAYDIDGNGTTGDAVIGCAFQMHPECRVSILPLGQPGIVDYKYNYFSYSLSANYRIAEPFSVFARYSRGARVNADRILFSHVDHGTGELTDKSAAYDPVRQAEVGVKYRNGDLMLNLTGFWAKTKEHNFFIERSYRAYGLEFEGGYRVGPWSLTAGATYTKAEILSDLFDPTTVGNDPKHQPALIFQATPQYTTDRFSIGAVIIGTTSSYAKDQNQLKLPGYTTVNAFVQFRPTEKMMVSLNANNLFDATGFVDADQASMVTTGGLMNARAINGRTVSTSVRFSF